MTEQLELIAREVLVQYPVRRAAFFGSASRDALENAKPDFRYNVRRAVFP